MDKIKKREVYTKKLRRFRCIKTAKEEKPPRVESIKDLIKMCISTTVYKNIDSYMLNRILPYLIELDELVGMSALKNTVFYQLLYYIQNMHMRNRNGEYLHTILTGPPGVGKTTVARIIGKLYQALGILSPNGPFVVAGRSDFVGEYLGQTAVKTMKLLKSCLGGVLFIDEVYALGPGQDSSGKDSFSKEALDTLTGFLSEHSNDFCCIAAGYEADIRKCFFAVNKGLESRFPWVHRIEKYEAHELSEIVVKMVSDMNWELSIDIEEITAFVKAHKDQFNFAGRDVYNFISKCKMSHSKRVLTLDDEHKFVLTRDDFEAGLLMVLECHPEKTSDTNPAAHMYL